MTAPHSTVSTDHMTPQDLAAAIVAGVLVLGILGLALLDRRIPAELSTALGSATTWLFVRSVTHAEARRNGS